MLNASSGLGNRSYISSVFVLDMNSSTKICKILFPIMKYWSIKKLFSYLEKLNVRKSLKIFVMKAFSILISLPKFHHFLFSCHQLLLYSGELVFSSSWEETRVKGNTPDFMLEHFIVLLSDGTCVTPNRWEFGIYSHGYSATTTLRVETKDETLQYIYND